MAFLSLPYSLLCTFLPPFTLFSLPCCCQDVCWWERAILTYSKAEQGHYCGDDEDRYIRGGASQYARLP